jgi:hypothetical protein
MRMIVPSVFRLLGEDHSVITQPLSRIMVPVRHGYGHGGAYPVARGRNMERFRQAFILP